MSEFDGMVFTRGTIVNEDEAKVILCAMFDLKALVNAEDWAEIVELKSDARESLNELIDTFPTIAKKLPENDDE